MNRLGILGDFIRNLFILLAQVLFFKNLSLFGGAFCFVYITILLQLSMMTNPLLQMVLAFVVGLMVDLFYNTMGMHAAASLFLVFVRIYWINLLTPRGGYDTGAKLNIGSQGLSWFLLYAYPLILIHSIVILFIEAGNFHYFWSTLAKGLYSSWFTLSVVLILQYSSYKSVK